MSKPGKSAGAVDEPNQGGRPEFEPTAAQRRRVSVSAGGGMSHEDIAMALKIARGTLEKHFAEELSHGAMERRVEVLEAMHKQATEKGNVTAQKAYLDKVPQAAVPPLPESPGDGASPAKSPKLGKKEQADADARTAADGTHWNDLLPKPGAKLQ